MLDLVATGLDKPPEVYGARTFRSQGDLAAAADAFASQYRAALQVCVCAVVRWPGCCPTLEGLVRLHNSALGCLSGAGRELQQLAHTQPRQQEAGCIHQPAWQQVYGWRCCQ